jgi:hypothetical protein
LLTSPGICSRVRSCSGEHTGRRGTGVEVDGIGVRLGSRVGSWLGVAEAWGEIACPGEVGAGGIGVIWEPQAHNKAAAKKAGRKRWNMTKF